MKIIKQLHKNRREIWGLRENGQIGDYNRKQHIASRRDQIQGTKSIQNLPDFPKDF
jgi:hypothetical protein